MSNTVDLAEATIASVQKDFRNRALTASELMAAILKRVRDTEPEVHAYANLDEQAAMDAAAGADRELLSNHPHGPLVGIPIGVKDLYSTKDFPTEAGSAILRGYKANSDAVAVQQLRTAGAIILGKQRTHEFGFGLDEPPTRNAWDTTRYPGGSTAGGAVSVAVTSCLAALGTDGGGSIRKPASLNGVVGLKPTFGKISTDGIIPGVTSVDHVGWITRSLTDSALLWEVLSGRSPEAATRGVSGLRIGCPSFFFRDLEQGIERRVQAGLDMLREAGAILVELDIAELETASHAHNIIASVESFAFHKNWVKEKPELYYPANLLNLQAAARISRRSLELAQQQRAELDMAMTEAFNEYSLDAMCTPTVALAAVPMNEMDPGTLLPRYTRLTVPFNLTGQPAISMPCGLDTNGLPVGFQIAARTNDEGMVLRIAGTVESSGLWTQPRSLGAVMKAQ